MGMASVAVFYLPHGHQPLVGGVSSFDLLDQAVDNSADLQTQELASAFCIPTTDKACNKCKDDCKKAAQKRKEKGIVPPYKWKYNADATQETGNGCTCTITGSTGKAEVVIGDTMKTLKAKIRKAKLANSKMKAAVKTASSQKNAQDFVDKVLRRAQHMKDLADVAE